MAAGVPLDRLGLTAEYTVATAAKFFPNVFCPGLVDSTWMQNPWVWRATCNM